MIRPRFLLPAAALVLLAACDPQASRPVLYGPVEEGLTLAFEDPSLPQPQRSQQRLQVRVAVAKLSEDGSGLVQADYTSLQGTLRLTLHHQKGGIALVGSDGRVLAQLLPEGFPAQTTWMDHGTTYRVIGRATWDGAAILPSDAATVGIWVEAQPTRGPLRRTLYLPGFGEVESLELRDGVWTSVNRLVSQGFTDLPTSARP